jgi:hypothetical protein
VNGPTSTSLNILVEGEFKKITFWEPMAFLQRDGPEYPHQVVTCVEILPPNLASNPNLSEWDYVKNYFYLSIPQMKNNVIINEIVSVRRIFFPRAFQLFEQNLQRARDMHSDNLLFHRNIQYRTLLWHGTGNINPLEYTKDGNLQKLSTTDKSLWGKGFYFSLDAAHAAAHAYQDKTTGNRKILLSMVITGSVATLSREPAD